MISDIKQVIVIRKDLKMRRGKEIAQGSHASLAFIARQLQGGKTKVELSEVEKQWINSNFAKICCHVNSEEELLNIYQQAKEAGLKVHLVTDSGKTEFNNMPTKTCLSIGPDYSEKIDKITGNLNLY